MSDQHDPEPGAESGPPSPVSTRRSVTTWLVAAAAAGLVAVAAVAISVRSGDDGASTSTTPADTIPPPGTEPSAPESTTPQTTVAAADTVPVTTEVIATSPTAPPTTVALPTPTTAVPSAAETPWNPDCTERFGDGEPPSTVDEVLTEFSTLAARPNLDIGIPTVDTANGPEPPVVRAAVVPGGVALVLEGFLGSTGYATVAAVIDADGSVRWRRCMQTGGTDGLIVPDDGVALTLVSTLVDGDVVDTFVHTIDLASGLDIGTPTRFGDAYVADVDEHLVLLGTTWTKPVAPEDDLLVVDVGDGSAREIPYPDIAVGGLSDSVRFEIVNGDDAERVVGVELGESMPGVVWTGDSWSSEPTALRSLPPLLRLPFGVEEPLRLVDGAGGVVWEVAGFHTISREGFNSAIADSVVLAMECLDWTDDFGCQWIDETTPPREQLVAFDLATGERLWVRPGVQSFAAIDGDRGIVTAEQGWELIDLRTGQRVDDEPVTTWSQDGIFANECCGAGDYIWTSLDGAVLFESTADRLRVWFPPEASTPTVATDAFR